MKILKFQNPIFSKYLNYTVRLGDKWADTKIGEKLRIANTKKIATIAFVTRTCLIWLATSGRDRPDILRYEHDPDCRLFVGLVRTLKKAYGKDRVDIFSPITCLGFYVSEE